MASRLGAAVPSDGDSVSIPSLRARQGCDKVRTGVAFVARISFSVHEHMLKIMTVPDLPLCYPFTTVGWLVRPRYSNTVVGPCQLPPMLVAVTVDPRSWGRSIYIHLAIPSFGVCRHPPTECLNIEDQVVLGQQLVGFGVPVFYTPRRS